MTPRGKFNLIVLLLVILVTPVLVYNYFNQKASSPPSAQEEIPKVPEVPKIPVITRSDARYKLQDLSYGLEKYYDDMKDETVYRCNVNLDKSVVFLPFVIIDNNFEVFLGLHIFTISDYPLFFDELYIRSKNERANFQINQFRKSEYNGVMSEEIYKFLKKAVNNGHLKIRLTGNDIGERDFSNKELSEIKAIFSIYEYFSSVKVK